MFPFDPPLDTRTTSSVDIATTVSFIHDRQYNPRFLPLKSQQWMLYFISIGIIYAYFQSDPSNS